MRQRRASSLWGAVIGLIAVWLQSSATRQTWGICVACFERDVAGGLGLHRAAIVQYLRPEIMGAGVRPAGRRHRHAGIQTARGFRTHRPFCPRHDSCHGRIGVPRCPWRAISARRRRRKRHPLALPAWPRGSVWDALFKKAIPLVAATARASSPGHSSPSSPSACSFFLPHFPANPGRRKAAPCSTREGPLAHSTPLHRFAGAGLHNRHFRAAQPFLHDGAFRDLLFRYTHLRRGWRPCSPPHWVNALTGGLKFGFEGQPVAHSDFLWNYLGMVTAGLAFALAGGHPGRQLFMAGKATATPAFLPSACWSARLWPTIWHGQFRYGHRRIRYAGDDHRFRRLPDHRLRPFQEGVKEYCHAYH